MRVYKICFFNYLRGLRTMLLCGVCFCAADCMCARAHARVNEFDVSTSLHEWGRWGRGNFEIERMREKYSSRERVS